MTMIIQFKRNFLNLILSCVINIFFRDINIINKKNVPTEGPLIVCGNHAN